MSCTHISLAPLRTFWPCMTFFLHKEGVGWVDRVMVLCHNQIGCGLLESVCLWWIWKPPTLAGVCLVTDSPHLPRCVTSNSSPHHIFIMLSSTNNAVIDQVKQGRTRVWQNVNVTASTINYLASYTKNINQVAFFPTFWDHKWFWFLYLSNVSEKGSRRTDLIQMEKYHLQLVCVSGLPEPLWLICGLDFQLFAVFRWLLIPEVVNQAIAERVDLPL